MKSETVSPITCIYCHKAVGRVESSETIPVKEDCCEKCYKKFHLGKITIPELKSEPILEPENPQKVATKTAFYLFGEVLPLTQNKQVELLEKELNVEMSVFLKHLLMGIAVDGMRPENWDKFLLYMTFVRDSANHILNPKKYSLPVLYRKKNGKMTIDPLDVS